MASQVEISSHFLVDDGTFPNNENLPLLLYRDVAPAGDPDRIEATLKAHQWGGAWRNGVYDYQHYHGTAHEILVVVSGKARLQLGGPEGLTIEVEGGDALLLPAGVAHMNLHSTPDFLIIGAYPAGQHYDMNYGRPGERPRADRNIEQVPLPELDPLLGKEGGLVEYWR